MTTTIKFEGELNCGKTTLLHFVRRKIEEQGYKVKRPEEPTLEVEQKNELEKNQIQ